MQIPGPPSVKRRVQIFALRSTIILRNSFRPFPQSQPKQKEPWYESNLFWGAFGLFTGIVLAVVAAMVKDLRWLLWLAFPAGCLSVWALTRSLRPRWMWLATIAGTVLIGIGLLRLNKALRPLVVPIATQEIDVLKPENARVAIEDIGFHPSTPNAPLNAWNFVLANKGGVPAHGILHPVTMFIEDSPLSAEAIRSRQDKNSNKENYWAAVERAPSYELYAGASDLTRFYSFPDRQGADEKALTVTLPLMLKGNKYIYLFHALQWRDSVMGADAVGITEICIYFYRSTSVAHDCGGRSHIEKVPKQTAPSTESGQLVPPPAQKAKVPNFAYLAPGVWLNSSTWDFLITRRGPDAMFNVEVLFVDTVKQKQVIAGRPSITSADINSYQSILKFPELDAHGHGSVFATQFLWTPPDADHEHYDITISWRDGTANEDLGIERVDGKWLWAMRVKDRDSGMVLVDCKDKGFPVSTPKQRGCFPEMTKND